MREWVLAAVIIALNPTVGMAASAEAGAVVFHKCQICHQLGKNAVGPNLVGVVGRKAGTAPNYNYSAAVKNSGITWDEANLNEWLEGPKKKIPGTKMMFAGLKDANDRANVIEYLKTQK
ncbi:MAG: cytochrome c family protein [Proteobacteria bacterium]|nr:cytochrome c family protein [Pseudomonadota bacterium]